MPPDWLVMVTVPPADGKRAHRPGPTDSASIPLQAIRGAVTANNRSGSIETLESAGATQAETASGSIRIAQASPAPVRAVSGSGAIHGALVAGSGYHLLLRSGKGMITANGIPATKQDQHSLDVALRGGGPEIDVQVRSFRIEIQ